MRNKIKFIIVLFFTFASLAAITPGRAMGFNLFGDVCKQDSNGSTNSTTCSGSSSSNNPISGSDGVIAKATKIIALVAGIAAVIMIIISGFQFVTSGGDSQKVATARQTILYAVIGIIIAAIAQSIVMFVLSR